MAQVEFQCRCTSGALLHGWRVRLNPGAERADRITILASDPRWAADFRRERDRLEPVLTPWLVRPLEHIGSTAVPGLAAKPIIDMLAVVHDRDRVTEAIAPLRELGWLLAAEPADAAERKLSLCFPSIEYRSHHLHVVEERSTGWPRWLAFRDHLRRHPELAAEYGRLKAGLAAEDDGDRPRYRAAKAPFIQRVLGELGYH